ncbi:MAG: hypothetical protein ACRDNI_07535 [Gaiellaceae bacterium]
MRSFPRCFLRAPWLEDVAVLAVAALATLQAEWRIISGSLTYQGDAQIHEYWMRRFQDSALFDDALTNALLDTGYSPLGFRGLYWLASHVVDPVFFGELLPLVLQPLAVWLVFRIVRDHNPWRPAAWLGAALFLVPWDIHRFSGGHPRAFAHVVLLLTVLLLMRRRSLLAAAVPVLGFLFYPPAGVTALAVVGLASLERLRLPFVNPRRAAWAALGAAALAVAALVPRLLGEASGELLSEAEARGYPEFGPSGQFHFFASSTVQYLKQNYSGFSLRESGGMLAVAALALLVVRPRNVRLLRWDVWCLAIAALGLFVLAHAVLFDLYLPHRYTYGLVPFFCIVIALALPATYEAVARRSRALLIAAVPLFSLGVVAVVLTVYPLGAQRSLAGLGDWLTRATPYLLVGFAVGLLVAAALWLLGGRERSAGAAAAAATVVAGSLLVGAVTFEGGRTSVERRCQDADLYEYLRTLPENAIVAGDARDVDCIPIAARRPVVISRKLYQPWDKEYFELIRERMFQTVDAMYGDSVESIVALRTRYGADYLVARNRIRERPAGGMAPFSREINRLRRTVEVPASSRLPNECETWRGEKFTVYSLACVAGEPSR